MRAFVFPGQGSQKVGMGVELAEASAVAREVFEEVDDALGQKLFQIMKEGPEDALTLTENAQPAIMANAIAVLRVLEKEGGIALADTADYVAGHSLGEYTALCAAGAFTLADTARLLKLRGQSMQAAVPVGVGAMAALLGIELEGALEACKEAAQGEVVAVANDNGGGQVVVSGHKAAVERTIEAVKPRGSKRGMLLPVSAPFHCPLMQPAADAMREALEKVTLSTPNVPLIANVLASEITNPADIKQRLVEQVTGMVRWTESVGWLAGEGGVTDLVELGTGKVLSGLAKRIAPDATAVSVGLPADVDAFVA